MSRTKIDSEAAAIAHRARKAARTNGVMGKVPFNIPTEMRRDHSQIADKFAEGHRYKRVGLLSAAQDAFDEARRLQAERRAKPYWLP